MLIDYPRRVPAGIELTSNLNHTLTMPHPDLRERYGDQQLLEDAIMLLLSSRRAKTNETCLENGRRSMGNI